MRWGRHTGQRKSAGPVIDISEQKGIRSLHLNSDTVQSSMLIADPYRLVLAYTKVVMGFLLFNPAPKDIWMIGLGGASLPKFIHRYLPASRCRVIELHPEVITMARSMFALPPDDNRLQVVLGDGAEYVMKHEAGCDVLIVDGFDGVQIAPELATPAFFANCAHALKDEGIFVMNLWGSDKGFQRHVEAISTAFEDRILLLPAREKGNVIAFAFKSPQGEPKWETLRERGKELQALLGLDFLDLVADLSRMNLCTEKRLLI